MDIRYGILTLIQPLIYNMHRLTLLLVITSSPWLMFFSIQKLQMSSLRGCEARLLFLLCYEKLSLTPRVLYLLSFWPFPHSGKFLIKHTNTYLSFKEHWKCWCPWKKLGLIQRNWLWLERGRPRTMQTGWWKSSQTQLFGMPLLSNPCNCCQHYSGIFLLSWHCSTHIWVPLHAISAADWWWILGCCSCNHGEYWAVLGCCWPANFYCCCHCQPLLSRTAICTTLFLE